MEYWLGVDLGTTYTAAAILTDDRVEVAQLGNRNDEIPSVVFVGSDGDISIGDTALRRGMHDPARIAREFKRRVGDPVPLRVGGAAYPAHIMMARVLEFVVDTVAARQEVAPAGVLVTCPANWGPFKIDLLLQAARLARVEGVSVRSEPEAAAVHYAASERVQPDEILAVYDLGGGTFDAAVLRKTANGFALLGQPEGIEQLGGVDFDDAVFKFVLESLGVGPHQLDPDDRSVQTALERLRRDCVDVKEALSYETEAAVPVALPNLHTQVRINRTEFERMIRPALGETIRCLRLAMRSAGVGAEQLKVVLLAGGSSRIPLISELVSKEFHRPVARDARPEHSIALGAALIARSLSVPAPTLHNLTRTARRPAGETDTETEPSGLATSAGRDAAATPNAETVSRQGAGDGRPRMSRRRIRWMVGSAAATVVVIGVTAIFASGAFRTEATAQPDSATWSRLANLPVALEGAAVAAYQGKVWVAGGISNDAERTKLTSTYVYDPATNVWAEGPSLPQPTSHAALVATSWGLYFIAGYVQNGGTSDVLLLNSTNTAWDIQSIPLPGTRVAGAAAFDGARIVFAGGTRADGSSGDEVWAFNTSTWTELGKLRHGRQKLSAVSDGDGTVWFMGGLDQQNAIRFGDIDVVSQGKLVTQPPANQVTIDPSVDSAAAVRVEGYGRCLVGGETPNSYNDWWCDQPGAAAQLPKLNPQRAGLGAAMVGKTIYVVGGYGSGFEGTDRLEAFTPAAN